MVEKSALRYTPAGLPAVDVSLKHESQIEGSKPPRTVAFELRGRAVGDVAEALAKAPLGGAFDFDGFLGAARNGRGIVLHIGGFRAAT